MGVTSYERKSVQFGKVQGDTAFERGEYTLFDNDNKPMDNGKWEKLIIHTVKISKFTVVGI